MLLTFHLRLLWLHNGLCDRVADSSRFMRIGIEHLQAIHNKTIGHQRLDTQYQRDCQGGCANRDGGYDME